MTSRVDVSAVVPAHNESGTLPELLERLARVLEGLTPRWEIVIVDDGSDDDSASLLAAAAAREPRIRPFAARRRRGQTAALRAGFRRARGDVLVTLDADLQNLPEDVPRLLSELAHADVVSGWRKDRREPFLSRRLPSLAANWWIRRLTGIPVHDHGCALKAYRREAVEDLHLYGDHHRLLVAFCWLAGARVREVPVGHAPRRAGRSKYGGRRVLRVLADVLAMNVLLRYRRRPSTWFLYLALPLAALASAAFLLSGLVTAGNRLEPDVVWLSAACILGVSSCSLGAMALFSEYLHRLEPFFAAGNGAREERCR